MRSTPISRDHHNLFALWADRLRAGLYLLLSAFKRRDTRLSSAADFYAALRKLGGNSRLPMRQSDTSTEYGARLKQGFPTLASEINLIVESFNLQVLW